jgi:hypothetical protein
MLQKTVRKQLVCWSYRAARGSISEEKIVEPGGKLSVRENEDPRATRRMAVLLNDEIVFCDRKQFWGAVE